MKAIDLTQKQDFSRVIIMTCSMFLNAEDIHHLKKDGRVFINGRFYKYNSGDLKLGLSLVEFLEES